MKKIFLLAAVLSVLLANIAEAADIKSHPRLAVMNFANKAITSEGFRDQDFSSAAEYAIYQLSASDWFDLIDYEQMATVAQLQAMNLSGLVDTSTAPVLGKFLSAQFVMVGALTGVTFKSSGASIKGPAGLSYAKGTVTVNVTVRFVDVETLKIVGVGMGTGQSSSANVEISFSPYRNIGNWIIPRETAEIAGEETITSATAGEYAIKIGTSDVSAVQVRNALSKAIRDAVYGKAGVLTSLNGGKQLKIKTGF